MLARARARHASLRSLLTPLYKAVHPDILGRHHPTCAAVNGASLARLNSLVDRLSGEPPPLAPPVPRSILRFFREVPRRDGEVVPRVFSLETPFIPALASERDQAIAQAQLVAAVEHILEESLHDRRFGNSPIGFWETEPAGSSPMPDAGDDALGSSMTPLQRRRQAELNADTVTKMAAQYDRQTQLQVLMHTADLRKRAYHQRRIFLRKQAQLQRKAIKTRNASRREKRLATVEDRAQAEVRRIFGDPSYGRSGHSSGSWMEELLQVREFAAQASGTDEGAQEEGAKMRIIEGGYHPELVWCVPSVERNASKRKTAVRRICGLDCSEPEFWLLNNLLKAMREPPAVPLCFNDSGMYIGDHPSGFVSIPWDFDVDKFAACLEAGLDQARARIRQKLRDAELAQPSA